MGIDPTTTVLRAQHSTIELQRRKSIVKFLLCTPAENRTRVSALSEQCSTTKLRERSLIIDIFLPTLGIEPRSIAYKASVLPLNYEGVV